MDNTPTISSDEADNNGGDSLYHVPVLLHESIEALQIKPGGVYVDCTFGGGGHSKKILESLDAGGKLFAFDHDEDARRNLPDDSRLIFIPQNYVHITRFLKLHKVVQVDGILADLGVSSHQLNEASRGFSFRFDAPLDMRMDKRNGVTAFNILDTYTELQLHKLFEQYGEVTNAKTLAKNIVTVRRHLDLKSIAGFKQAIYDVVKGNPNKYFAQVFQALRIEVNEELKGLEKLLAQIPDLLKPGGRAAIITFHSLEDRLVKNFFKGDAAEDENPFLPTTKKHLLKVITKKPIGPSEDELKANTRARSSKLRVAEKIAT